MSEPRDLRDTPFAESRLRVWAVGFVVAFSTVASFVLALLGKDVPQVMIDAIKVGMGGLLMSGGRGAR